MTNDHGINLNDRRRQREQRQRTPEEQAELMAQVEHASQQPVEPAHVAEIVERVQQLTMQVRQRDNAMPVSVEDVVGYLELDLHMLKHVTCTRGNPYPSLTSIAANALWGAASLLAVSKQLEDLRGEDGAERDGPDGD